MKGTRFHISNDNGGNTRISDLTPPGLQKYLINISHARTCMSNGDSWLVQRISKGSFNLYLFEQTANHGSKQTISISIPFVGLYFVLAGGVSINSTVADERNIATGEFGFFFIPASTIEIAFETGPTHSIMVIEIDTSLFAGYRQLFGFLGTLEEYRKFDSPSLIASHTSLAMLAVIQQIRYNKLSRDINRVYLGYKVPELLLLSFLELSIDRDRPMYYLHPDDKEKIQQIMADIARNPEKEFSIRQLARSSGLNTDKLKQGFKHLYGDTIFGALSRYRMDLALSLLKETDKPVQHIAYLTGYSDSPSFIKAFKKHFGVPPGAYRK